MSYQLYWALIGAAILLAVVGVVVGVRALRVRLRAARAQRTPANLAMVVAPASAMEEPAADVIGVMGATTESLLTPDELAALRRQIQADLQLPYIKPVLNAGIQAAEDWWENTGRVSGRDAVKSAMIAAGAPGVTNGEARQVLKHWLRDKFSRGG